MWPARCHAAAGCSSEPRSNGEYTYLRLCVTACAHAPASSASKLEFVCDPVRSPGRPREYGSQIAMQLTRVRAPTAHRCCTVGGRSPGRRYPILWSGDAGEQARTPAPRRHEPSQSQMQAIFTSSASGHRARPAGGSTPLYRRIGSCTCTACVARNYLAGRPECRMDGHWVPSAGNLDG